jgi:hypothetical protein
MNTEILTKELYNFIEGLRLAGYNNIGTAQFIAAQDIVLALVAQGKLPSKLAQLKTLLGAVLCHSPKEQEEFARHFDNWMSQIELLVTLEAKGTPDMEVTSTGSKTKISAKTQFISENIKSVLRNINKKIITLLQSLFIIVASVLQAILRGSLKLGEYPGQRFLARRKVTLIRPKIELFVKNIDESLFNSVNLLESAKHLRTYTPILKKNQFDIALTVEKTAQAAGLFTPVIEAIKRIPQYLVLIDKVSSIDHQTHLIDTLINQLIAKGVLITRYYFYIDPRTCYPVQEPLIPLFIEELVILYPKHRLLIFSDSSRLIDTAISQVVHWITQFSVWWQRVLFTLETPEQWGYQEQLLEKAGFVIMPATEAGLAAYAEQISTGTRLPYLKPSESVSAKYPSYLNEIPEKWVDDHAPDSAVLTELLIQLWDFLGETGYYWFSACAIYPELRWQLTLYLGYQLSSEDGQKLFNSTLLAKLVRLPWFRYGYMPNWLRKQLVQDLSLSQEREIRTALQTLLLTALDNPSLGFSLEIAKPTKTTRFSARQLLQRLKISKQDAKDDSLRDYVFPAFMASPLAVKIPKMLRRLLVEPQLIDTLRAAKEASVQKPNSKKRISQQQLRQEITRLKQRYDSITEKIAELKQQKKSATRIEKILYLQSLIEETTAKHEQVKKGISQLETLTEKLVRESGNITAKKAFLVGVNTFGLQFAEKDTELMNECLAKYGYEIVKPDKKEKYSILKQFEEMLDKCNKTDTIIFYYSGHGVLLKGKLHLVLGDDASKEVSNKLRITGISELLENCRATNKLIILDCCHVGAVHADLHIDLPDAYRLLTASTRLERSKELDEFQASFLTYQIHQTLMQPPSEICVDNSIQISAFYQWLVKVAKQQNSNHSIQVPIPNLLGNEKANFEIARCEQKFRAIPRFLPYQVNREKQEQTLAEAIQTHSQHPDNKQRPFLCLIHGNEDECSDMFVELLEKNILRKIAPRQTQNGIKRYTFSGGNFNNINELHQNMLTGLGKALCHNLRASHAEIVKAIGQHEQKVVMLYTSLCSEDWQHEINILHGFLEFWTDLPALSSNHLLLVCLSFSYQKDKEKITHLKRFKSINQEIRKAFQSLEFNKFKVSGVVLPELESMTEGMVHDWARRYVSQFCDIDVLYQEIKKNIFTSEGQKIAMEPLADQLKQILQEHCTLAADESPRLLALRLLENLRLNQFRKVLSLYDIPKEYLSIDTSQGEQHIELIEYALQKEGEQLTKLLEVIDQVRGKTS